MSDHTTASAARGGGWLLDGTSPDLVFTPERFTDEHRLIAQTADEFVEAEVLPHVDRMDQKDWPFVRHLMRRCGALGLLGVDVPERFGGVGLDKVSALLVSERVSRNASFATTFGGQTNLSIMSLLLFGTEAQRCTYLPRLVAGDIVGAYALSESGAGSDAMACTTRADRQADGSYLLNGEKMWVSNGGFADVITVFAKVDGRHLTAFIVERAWPGVTSGKEEHKLGLHGSSTTPIVLQDVRVTADHVLGDVGRGHRVAFNVLNVGRLKLGSMCSGGAVSIVGEAARYAAARRQFGRPIASFGAVKHKLGEMTARLYALESQLYRTAGLVDGYTAAYRRSDDDVAAVREAGEEFAVEASISKVAGSELADFVADENVQIHGGNGFVRDYPAERHYRDARVNRIFEGTNEINRLLIPAILVKRALKGDLPLLAAAERLQAELLGPSTTPGRGAIGEDSMAGDLHTIAGMKKAAIALLALGMLTRGEAFTDDQEVLMSIADIVIDIYLSESATLRALAAQHNAAPRAALHGDAARVFVTDAATRVEANARQALAGLAEGDELRIHLAALRRLLKPAPVNTIALRRRLSDATVDKGAYIFRD